MRKMYSKNQVESLAEDVATAVLEDNLVDMVNGAIDEGEIVIPVSETKLYLHRIEFNSMTFYTINTSNVAFTTETLITLLTSLGATSPANAYKSCIFTCYFPSNGVVSGANEQYGPVGFYATGNTLKTYTYYLTTANSALYAVSYGTKIEFTISGSSISLSPSLSYSNLGLTFVADTIIEL